ncbi:MAG: PSD1 and planctomycete cytochrome C domain-containing protein [Verrucomicrobiota bacterium]|nr:PSD1 and planctomycete cytochrome C domain-containing protein [Verrucomicrobiota bacterium]
MKFPTRLTLSFCLLLFAGQTEQVFGAFDQSKLPSAANHKINFTQEIQPIFQEHCYQCHGPKKQEAGLRWDQKSSAMKGGESGAAIMPGKSGESLIIQAVSRLREDLKMPKKGEPLTAPQIGLLRAWIDQGAEWPDTGLASQDSKLNHWAFKMPVRPKLPIVKNKNRVRTPIDNFIFARLEKENLNPAPETDKITLLRRLSLDLVGLPPTISEVEAFLADKSSDAYEKQVERLLASPHYGERWGRQWLDAARYADSDGFEKDKARAVWPYRDYVINAFNKDLPYDQFVIEQLAGDLLPKATQDQIVATGFLRNSMLNEEGGVDPEQFRMDAMFDRMEAVGKSVLGLTIQCAQCHNHKFDPISQEDYYRMFAFLNNDHESSRVIYSPDNLMKIEQLRRDISEIETDLKQKNSDWEKQMAKWEESVKNDQPDWSIVTCTNAGDNGERFYYYADGSIRAASYAPTKWTANFRGTNNLSVIGAFRLEQMTDPNLPAGGPGRSLKGMAALTEFNVEAVDAKNPTNKIEIKFVKATADFSNPEKDLEPEFDDRSKKRRPYGRIEFAIDGKDDTAWGIDAGPGRRNQARKAVFIPDKPITFTNGVILNFKLKQEHGGWNSDDNQTHNLGRFRLSVTSATNVVADPLPAKIREIFKTPPEQRSPAQTAAIFSYWRTTMADWKEANEKIESLWKQWPEGIATLTLVARKNQGAGDEKRETRLLKRGDWLKPSQEVTAGVPSFLHALPPKADDTRLTFAKWLVDKKSPTTARVFVNRIWQSYFGIGLVNTPEDFGLQSEAPSHPELLDWLACEFMNPESDVRSQNGNDSRLKTQDSRPWSLKHIHRLIVNSSTYQQSSKVTPELYARDQYNRLLARGPRFRVEGEIVRDITLASSGLLNETIGGPSVFSPAPEFLFKPPASYGPKTWIEATGQDRYRRALYTFRYRSVPYPMLQAFDAPNGDFSCVRRMRSNTPLQALMTLNETLSMECAQALAKRTLQEGGTTDLERIRYAFRRTLSREPAKDEEEDLLNLLVRQKQRIAEGWINPHELATGKNETPRSLPPGATPTQLAAYTVVSRVLLNLDETITKE